MFGVLHNEIRGIPAFEVRAYMPLERYRTSSSDWLLLCHGVLRIADSHITHKIRVRSSHCTMLVNLHKTKGEGKSAQPWLGLLDMAITLTHLHLHYPLSLTCLQIGDADVGPGAHSLFCRSLP